MAETKEGQAKLDKMLAAGMGRQQALKILINAQKKANAAAAAASSSSPSKSSPAQEPEPAAKPVEPAPAAPAPAASSSSTAQGAYESAGTSSAPTPAEPISIKAATPDILITDSDILPETLMASLIFENIGGQELLTVTRHDLVNGQNIVYQPIVNLSDISLRYNSKNIITVPESSDEVFQQFPIRIEQHIPGESDLNGEDIVYMSNTGDIVVNCLDPNEDYLIEVEILSTGNIFNDTIY